MKRKITLEGRLHLSSGRATNALSLFEQAATELEAAAGELKTVAGEADDKAAYFGAMRDTAVQEAVRAVNSAEKVRGLFQ